MAVSSIERPRPAVANLLLETHKSSQLFRRLLAVAFVLGTAIAAPVDGPLGPREEISNADPIPSSTTDLSMTPTCSDRNTQNTCLATNAKPYCVQNKFHSNLGDVCKDCWCV